MGILEIDQSKTGRDIPPLPEGVRPEFAVENEVKDLKKPVSTESEDELALKIKKFLSETDQGKALIVERGLDEAIQEAKSAITKQIEANPLLPEAEVEKKALQRFVDALHAPPPSNKSEIGSHWNSLNQELMGASKNAQNN